jgi:hypothetical protein
LFAEQCPGNDPTNPLKGRIAEFTARVVRKHPEYPAQALINGKRIGREPEPPYFAYVRRFVIVHIDRQISESSSFLPVSEKVYHFTPK